MISTELTGLAGYVHHMPPVVFMYNRQPLILQDLMDSIGCADIQTANRIRGDQQLGGAADLSGQQQFLHIAAGHEADRAVDSGTLDFITLNQLFRTLCHLIDTHDAVTAGSLRIEITKHGVVYRT